jgi:cytoskeletal protein CcmA (bactofilin family)
MSDEQTDTVISDDIVFKGNIKFQTSLRVRGHIKGTIEATGELIVDDVGVIDADIYVNSLKANGTIKGNIEAIEKIEVGKTGVIIGDIKSPLLQMESGSKFTGNCAM